MSSARHYGDVGGAAEAGNAVAVVGQTGAVDTVPCAADSGYDEVTVLRRQVAQLQQALQRRGVIEQAKGMLMLRYDVDSERAFAILRRLSQHRNVKLHTVADTLVHAVCGHDVATSRDAALVRWLREQLDMGESRSAGRTGGPMMGDDLSIRGDGTCRSPTSTGRRGPSTAPMP